MVTLSFKKVKILKEALLSAFLLSKGNTNVKYSLKLLDGNHILELGNLYKVRILCLSNDLQEMFQPISEYITVHI